MDNKTVDTELIAKFIVYVIAIINTVCTMAGFPLLNLGESEITTVVNIVVTVVVWCFGIYKNFNVTKEAKEAQVYLNSLKSCKNK